MKVEGTLEKLQDAIEKQLLGLNELRNVPILTYKQSDLTSVIEANIKTDVGTAILLMPPVPNEVRKHVNGLVFDDVSVEIKIIENTATNKCGRSLLFLAEVVMQCLHMWHPGIPDENYRLELISGPGSCSATRENDINYFVMHFAIPYHLKSE